MQYPIMETRPKRALSAFNLYYRYKRTIILNANTSDDEKSETSSSSSTDGGEGNNTAIADGSNGTSNNKNKENIQRLITSIPGLESYTPETLSTLSPTKRNEISRTEIRNVLVNNLSPNEGTRDRLHRKSHGCMSFIEMSKIMSTSWKSIDEYSKSVFEELAQEGRVVQQERVAEYEKMNPPQPEAMPSSSDGGGGEGLVSVDEQQLLLNNDGNLNQHPFLGNYNQYNTGADTPLSNKSPASSQGSSPKSTKKSSKKRSKATNDAPDTPTRPKRPLSAYNLFYRYKRIKILKAYSTGHDSKDYITQLLERVPGLEDYPTIEYDPSKEKEPPQNVKDICSAEIRAILEDNLSPNETRDRLHRKSHGYMSFTEMSKIMCDSWKAIDDYTKSVFEELAQKGRKMYQARVAIYEKLKKPSAVKKQKLDNYAEKATKITTSPASSGTVKSKMSKKMMMQQMQQQLEQQQHQMPIANNPDFDQLCNPNHFKNLDYYHPQAQGMIQTQGIQAPSSTASPATGTPPIMMMLPGPNHPQGQAYHQHSMLARHGGPPHQQQQSVQVSPETPPKLELSSPGGGHGSGFGHGSGNNSFMSSVAFDNMELEPLPIFPNIFEMSDDEGTQQARGTEQVSMSDGTSSCDSVGAVNGSQDIIPPSSSDNNNEYMVMQVPRAQGEAMLRQMSQMGVQPHQLHHLPHNNNMYYHGPPSHNMQGPAGQHQHHQQVGMMYPPVYSYPRPPSYTDMVGSNINNNATTAAGNINNSSDGLSSPSSLRTSTSGTSSSGRIQDTSQDDLMKAAILVDDVGGRRNSTSSSVESNRANLDDFLESIFK